MLGIKFKVCLTIFSTAALTVEAEETVFAGTEVNENLVKYFGVIEKRRIKSDIEHNNSYV